MRRSLPHVLLLGSSLTFLLLAAPACETGEVDTPAPGPSEPAVEGSEAIINGTADTVNKSVCALVVQQGGGFAPFCTGTIIAKNGSTAYAISAAHCIDQGASPDALVCADDYNDCPGAGCKVFNVTSVTVHPDYDGSPSADISMLTLSNAADADVTPAAGASDGLSEGTPLEFSGYGVTNGFSQTSSNRRNHSFSIVDDADGDGTGLYLNAIEAPQSHDGQYGGTCFGDSGGPAFTGDGASKRLVGITSQGDGECDQVGYYARVEYLWPFVEAYIGGEPQPQDCQGCVDSSVSPGGTCAAQFDACVATQACNDLLTCIGGCTTDACVQNCANAYPDGIDQYNGVVDCAICTACDASCQDPSCGGGATTGVGATTGTGAGATSGAGGGAGDGGGSADDDDDDDDDDGSDDGDRADGTDGETTTTTCDCAVPGGASSTSSPSWLVGIALAAGLVGRRRRADPAGRAGSVDRSKRGAR